MFRLSILNLRDWREKSYLWWSVYRLTLARVEGCYRFENNLQVSIWAKAGCSSLKKESLGKFSRSQAVFFAVT